MPGKRKAHREKDLTRQYLSGSLNDDRVDRNQRFGSKSKHHQMNKIASTTRKRAERAIDPAQVDALPVGEITQVYSLYAEVRSGETTRLAVVRKTLNKVSATSVVVGDRVRFRAIEGDEAVIEQVLPRDTVLTRADSFKALTNHPIVANAQRMLIVVSVAYPKTKWGLVDRMLIAAQSGGLSPVLCLNKVDCASEFPDEWEFSKTALGHYQSLGIATLQSSVEQNSGLDEVRSVLRDRTTVLAGHSGVGKSSLIRAIEPSLDVRVGAISNYNQKGRHTTTSARTYPLSFGGRVIDTPGVKLFGLWNVTPDSLEDFFPDIADGTAPKWRRESFERILASLQ